MTLKGLFVAAVMAVASIASGATAQAASPPSTPSSTQIITLPPAMCASVNAAYPGSAPGCKALHYSGSTNYQPLTAAQAKMTTMQAAAGTAAAGTAPYYYWSAWDAICALGGCWIWKMTLAEDGDANGFNVWQWHIWCTPQGYGASLAWCGYAYNGGWYPMYAMDFGMDGNVCIAFNSIGCVGHGMRRWIKDNGAPGNYYWW